MTELQTLIQFDRVSVSINRKTLLNNLSFRLGEGEKAVFRGKSGSGKSTVLKTLLGVHPLSSGEIRFHGSPLDKVAIAAIRRCAAYIGQEPMLGAKTVREALLLPFQFKAHHDAKPSEAQIIAALGRLHLPAEMLEQDCARVSGGEKQRIALARALLLGKSLYLLDEVTSALDEESKKAVFELLAAPGLAILSVAHDAEWIARCGRVLDLENGTLVREESNVHT